jgi:hypothetical protein
MEAVSAVMPQEHMKLLTNIQKTKKQTEKKKKSVNAMEEETDNKSVHSKASTAKYMLLAYLITSVTCHSCTLVTSGFFYSLCFSNICGLEKLTCSFCRRSKWNHTDVFSDDNEEDDSDDDMYESTKATSMTKASLASKYQGTTK